MDLFEYPIMSFKYYVISSATTLTLILITRQCYCSFEIYQMIDNRSWNSLSFGKLQSLTRKRDFLFFSTSKLFADAINANASVHSL